MLSLCPRGVLRGYSISSRTLFGQVQHTYVGIALTRSSTWVSYDLDDGRADVDTRVFYAKTAISCANPPISCDTL